MIRVLVITNLLPIKEIQHKKNENDILLVIEDQLKIKYPQISFKYLYVLPYTNKILAMMSAKWRSYYKLKKKEECDVYGRNVNILDVIQLPWTTFFRSILYDISLLSKRKYLEKLISDFNPTIVHAQNADLDAYIAKKIRLKFGIPYVITLRGLNRIVDKTVMANIDSANDLIAISPTQNNLIKKGIGKKIKFIPHGIPKSFYSKTDKNDKKLDSVFRLISVCRLLKLKNLDLVIEALSNIEDEYIYDIYGEGPEKLKLEKLINKYGLTNKIRLRGIIPNAELPEIFKNYNLFVMPSFPETLGRVYFEAMATGLPILATKNTGVDGIINDGNEGYLINPNNKTEIEDTLKYAISNRLRLEEMGEKAFNLAGKYSWNEIIPKIKDIYS